MSQYTINIDDDAIFQQINNIINAIFEKEMKRKYGDIDDVLSQAVKELVYFRKDEIVDRVIERATKEIVRKGLPKLLEKGCGE